MRSILSKAKEMRFKILAPNIFLRNLMRLLNCLYLDIHITKNYKKLIL